MMKTDTPHIEDKLLDFTYGELPAADAQAVKAHLAACSACTQALASIQGVRRVMSRLPLEAAPASGLESLLGYAEQAARQAAAGPAPHRPSWVRWLIPAFGLTATVVIGVIVTSRARAPVGLDQSRVAEAVSAPAAPMPPLAAASPARAASQPADPLAMNGLRDLDGAPAAKGDLADKVRVLAKKSASRRDGPEPLREKDAKAEAPAPSEREEQDEGRDFGAAERAATGGFKRSEAGPPATVVAQAAPPAPAVALGRLHAANAAGATSSAGLVGPSGGKGNKEDAPSDDRNLESEEQALARAIAASSPGTRQAELLAQLCEVQERLGRPEYACARLQRDYPAHRATQALVARRQKREQAPEAAKASAPAKAKVDVAEPAAQ